MSLRKPPPDSWLRRGGSAAEYEIYRALWGTGRKEPTDFVFINTFILNTPRVQLSVVPSFQLDSVRQLQGIASGLETRQIPESEALSDGASALRRAIGGR